MDSLDFYNDSHNLSVLWYINSVNTHFHVQKHYYDNDSYDFGLFGHKVKSCYNPLRLGTVIVLISSGIDFVNNPICIATEPPAEKDCQFSLMVFARGSPKCLDFTRNTPQLNQLCPR